VVVTVDEVRTHVRDNNMRDAVVCLHSSFKSFGLVDGGPQTIVSAFLLEGCTVVVPTYSHGCAVNPPPNLHIERNGDSETIDETDVPRFSVKSKYITAGMGAIPEWVLQQPESLRGNHPRNSFTAIGPLAREATEMQNTRDVFAPQRFVAENNGVIVMAGVDLTAMTLIHLAEQQAGREPFVRWALLTDGRRVPTQAGCCSSGFERLAPLLADALTTTVVGQSSWRIYDAKLALQLATEAIRKEPTITHCPNSACVRCDDMIAGGPVYDLKDVFGAP